jgi:hypothetical protein
MFTEQRALWIYEQYKWLERALPKRRDESKFPLIVPTAAYFPERYAKTHESAEKLFNRVRDRMGMRNWDCELVQTGSTQSKLQSALRDSGIVGETSTHEAAGTFSVRERVTITYAPSALDDPLVLVALFAHELSHYLLAASKEKPACGKDDLEPLTDLTAVFEGFGLFSCHASFQFKQWTDAFRQGWSVKRLGYMSEAEFAFGVGLFCVRNQVDYRLAAKYLRPNPRQVFVDSIDYIIELENTK